MPAKAIGLLNSTVSESRSHDERLVVDLAHMRGFQLVHTLTIDADTYMPTTLILWTAHQHGATAIVAPNLTHLPGTSTPDAIALACALITPTLTISHVQH